MPKTINQVFHICTICEKKYTERSEAEKCENSHEIVYLELTRDEVRRLRVILEMSDSDLITRDLYKKIAKAARLRGHTL